MVRYCKALGDWEVSLKKNQIKKKKNTLIFYTPYMTLLLLDLVAIQDEILWEQVKTECNEQEKEQW